MRFRALLEGGNAHQSPSLGKYSGNSEINRSSIAHKPMLPCTDAESVNELRTNEVLRYVTLEWSLTANTLQYNIVSRARDFHA